MIDPRLIRETGTVLGEVDLPSCRSTEEAFEAFFQGSQLKLLYC